MRKDGIKKYLAVMALVWVISFLVLATGYMLFVKPKLNKIENLSDELSEKQQRYAAAKKAASQDSKMELMAEMERLEERVNDFTVKAADSADMIFDLSRIAKALKVDELSIKNNTRVSGLKDTDYLALSGLSVSFNSGFLEFASYLNSLERHRPLVFVDEFRIRSRMDGEVRDVFFDLSMFTRVH